MGLMLFIIRSGILWMPGRLIDGDGDMREVGYIAADLQRNVETISFNMTKLRYMQELCDSIL